MALVGIARMIVACRGIVDGLVGATSSVFAGGLNDTAGAAAGWMTGGVAQSLSASAGHNSDQALMAAAAASLYQQQPTHIQQVNSLLLPPL